MTETYSKLSDVRALICVFLTMLLLTVQFTLNQAIAEDLETRGKNAVEDVKTATSKTVRKAKKGVRKAAGTDSEGKDVQDAGNDAKNDVENKVNKIKNRENQ